MQGRMTDDTKCAHANTNCRQTNRSNAGDIGGGGEVDTAQRLRLDGEKGRNREWYSSMQGSKQQRPEEVSKDSKKRTGGARTFGAIPARERN